MSSNSSSLGGTKLALSQLSYVPAFVYLLLFIEADFDGQALTTMDSISQACLVTFSRTNWFTIRSLLH